MRGPAGSKTIEWGRADRGTGILTWIITTPERVEPRYLLSLNLLFSLGPMGSVPATRSGILVVSDRGKLKCSAVAGM
jgi:hypothetical protein